MMRHHHTFFWLSLYLSITLAFGILTSPVRAKTSLLAGADGRANRTPHEIGARPIVQEPESGECDLAITEAHPIDFRPGSVIIMFQIEISNRGRSSSPPAEVVVHDEERQVAGTAMVEGLAPGESRGLEVVVEAPDMWWNTTHNFIAEVDPEQAAPDENRGNNTFAMSNIVIPPAPAPGATSLPNSNTNPPANPTPNGNLLILIGIVVAVGVIGVVILGSSGLLVRSSIKTSERKLWEKQAKQGKPSGDCQPSRRYCQVETDIELKLMRVTQLEFVATDPTSGQERRRQTFTGHLPANLGSVVLAHRLGTSTGELSPRIEKLTQELSQSLAHSLQGDQASYNVTVSAHLEGIEVTSTFTLYQCVGTPPKTIWKKIAQWEASKQQERDDDILALAEVSGTDASITVRLPIEIYPQMRDYIERY
jgi:hypothetical protein